MHPDEIMELVADAEDRGPLDSEARPVAVFLDGVRAGYAEKFAKIFEDFGLELVGDLREAPAEELIVAEGKLEASGAGPAHIRRIREAIDALRGKESKKKTPTSATEPDASGKPTTERADRAAILAEIEALQAELGRKQAELQSLDALQEGAEDHGTDAQKAEPGVELPLERRQPSYETQSDGTFPGRYDVTAQKSDGTVQGRNPFDDSEDDGGEKMVGHVVTEPRAPEDEWEEHVQPGGMKSWFNARTLETRWESPYSSPVGVTGSESFPPYAASAPLLSWRSKSFGSPTGEPTWTAEEMRSYAQFYNECSDGDATRCKLFLEGSALPQPTLKEIIRQHGFDMRRIIGPQKFYAACRQVAHCQHLEKEDEYFKILNTGGEDLRTLLDGCLHDPPPRLPRFNASEKS